MVCNVSLHGKLALSQFLNALKSLHFHFRLCLKLDIAVFFTKCTRTAYDRIQFQDLMHCSQACDHCNPQKAVNSVKI